MRVLVTGGAGYIGSLLSATLLRDGHEVIVVDRLMFGGDPILPLFAYPRFAFHKLDVAEVELDPLLAGIDIVYHLAALVGFPACDAAGEDLAFLQNRSATERAFEAAERMGVARFIFASSYSNYGLATDGRPVTEDSPLMPRSLYARTKIAAEEYLRGRASRAHCAPVIPRFTTLFGVSPRTRFDLLVNQFVLEALTDRRLIVFQGNYTRSFVHVRDVVRALLLLATAPDDDVRGEIFNVGAENGNRTKTEVVELIRRLIPGVVVESRDLSWTADLRDVSVSCQKIRDRLGYDITVPIEEGIREVRDAIETGLIGDPRSPRYRNHVPIVH